VKCSGGRLAFSPIAGRPLLACPNRPPEQDGGAWRFSVSSCLDRYVRSRPREAAPLSAAAGLAAGLFIAARR
jgi:hypothetical protein